MGNHLYLSNIDLNVNDTNSNVLLKDSESSHYLGKLNSDIPPTTATITLDGASESITVTANDWINLQTKPDAYIWNGTAWVQFSGGGLTKTKIVSSINTAAPSATAPVGTILNLWTIDETNETLIFNQVAFEESIKTTGKYTPTIWDTKSWTGLTNFSGSSIWTDGYNIYCSTRDWSSGGTSYAHYILDKSTSTWNTKSWSGLTDFDGTYIWTDGDNIYCSNSGNNYVLDKSTSAWSAKTWTGLTSFGGADIWTDGENVYHSHQSNQYVLNKATSTWTAKTWTGLTNFNGYLIWTDGENVYYSSGSTQYVLNKSTSTWSTKSWSGLTSFYGNYIWTDGENVYYSVDTSTQYVLDKSTSTWVAKTWTGLTDFHGDGIWTDGDNIYYSYLGGSSSPQYVLE